MLLTTCCIPILKYKRLLKLRLRITEHKFSLLVKLIKGNLTLTDTLLGLFLQTEAQERAGRLQNRIKLLFVHDLHTHLGLRPTPELELTE